MGREGDGRLYGGSGNDLLEGGSGRDWQNGGPGEDTFWGYLPGKPGGGRLDLLLPGPPSSIQVTEYAGYTTFGVTDDDTDAVLRVDATELRLDTDYFFVRASGAVGSRASASCLSSHGSSVTAVGLHVAKLRKGSDFFLRGGVPGGIRTHDLQLRRLSLYPAELRRR